MSKLLFLVLFLISSLLLFAEKSAEDFDFLMGKETEHWHYVERKEDIAFLEKIKKHYLSFHEPSSPASFCIPPTVHFIWLGPSPFPPRSVETIRSWMAFHPEWKFKFWTDRDVDPPCQGMETVFIDSYPFSKLKNCYLSSVNWGEKSDILRYEILYEEGGVYVDHDALCLRSFAPLHKSYGFYAGLETPHPPILQEGKGSLTFGNGVIGARAFHPLIRQTIENIAQRWDSLAKKYNEADFFSKTQLVMERTYLALTLTVKEQEALPPDAALLPAAYFFAKSGIKPLYSEHLFANSWAKEAPLNLPFQKLTKKLLYKAEKKLALSYRLLAIFCVSQAVLLYILIKKIKRRKAL